MSDSAQAAPQHEPGVAKRTLPEPEIQIAAAALAAAVSAPLGVAVALGSALRSRRIRATLRKGTVHALAGAIQLGDQLTAVAHRAHDAAPATEGPGTPQNGPRATAASTDDGA